MGDSRFVPHLARVVAAENPAEAIHSLSDDGVISALAAASQGNDPYLANVLATEAMNRMRRSRVVAGAIGEGVVALDLNRRVTFMNQAAEELLQVRKGAMLGQPARQVLRAEGPGCTPEAGGPCPLLDSLGEDTSVRRDDLSFTRADGSHFPVSCTATQLMRGTTPTGYVIVFRNISEQKQSEALLGGQNRVLEQIARGTALPVVLETLVEAIEGVSDGMKVGILLVAPDGKRLLTGAGPSLPEPYSRALEGIEIGTTVGPCSTAAHLREQIIMTDIASDDRWPTFRGLAVSHGFAACWSSPIFSAAGEPLGTFALYYDKPREPTADDFRLIEAATHLAGIAIERQQMDAQMRDLAVDLERRVRDRTRDLRLANEELEAFTYLVSHDLKEPVRAIHAYLQALAEDHARQLPSDAAGLVERTRAANRRLDSLINGLLEISRASRIDPSQFHPIAVSDVLQMEEFTTRFNALLEDRRGRLEVGLEPDATVSASAPALCQVLGNLILNAVKHNGNQAPVVTIRGGGRDASGHFVEVHVVDNGNGFPQDLITRFSDGGAPAAGLSSLHRRDGGFGLTIVQRVIDRLGGHLRIGNAADGGACVTVLLPAAAAATGSAGVRGGGSPPQIPCT